MRWLARRLHALGELLVRVALALEPPPPPPAPVPWATGIDSNLRAAAGELVRKEWADNSAHEGELRRHRVYAALIKEFPGVRRRTLSKAIEVALEEEYPSA